MDDNDEIIRTAMLGWYPFKDAIESRLAVGVETYGHGVRVNDDTTQWGTKTNSWLEMGLEEIDDLAIYVAAQLCREVREYLGGKPVFDIDKYNKLMDSLAEARKQIIDLMENNG